jgi:hypothetical protein
VPRNFGIIAHIASRFENSIARLWSLKQRDQLRRFVLAPIPAALPQVD